MRQRLAVARAYTKPVSAYGPGSPHSWFADMLLKSEAEARSDAAVTHPVLRGTDGGSPLIEDSNSYLHSDITEVRSRLRTVETRALSSAAAADGEFIPAGGVPVEIADAFAAAARAEARLPAALGSRPLPDSGLTVQTPRFTTGASATMQSDGAAVSSTDPGSANTSSPVGTVSGYVDVSRQLFDRSTPGIDTALATELGRALGERLDVQIISGSGTAPNLRGLLSVTGVYNETYTSAGPTQMGLWTRIMSAYSNVSTLLGDPPDLVIWAPRGSAWISNWIGSDNTPARPLWPAGVTNVVEAPAMPVNLGAGTNEDRIILVDSDEVLLFLNAPQIRVMENPLSGNFQLRIEAFQYAALLANRQPASIGIVSGTGLAGATF